MEKDILLAKETAKSDTSSKGKSNVVVKNVSANLAAKKIKKVVESDKASPEKPSKKIVPAFTERKAVKAKNEKIIDEKEVIKGKGKSVSSSNVRKEDKNEKSNGTVKTPSKGVKTTAKKDNSSAKSKKTPVVSKGKTSVTIKKPKENSKKSGF